MSSRLFQRIREELGLAYAIFAYQHFYQSAGQFGVYVGTQPATAAAAERAIRAEYAGWRGKGSRRRAGRRQAAAQGAVHAVAGEPGEPDAPAGRVHAARRPLPALDEILAEIDAVTGCSYRAVAAEFFAPDRQTVVRLGPESRERLTENSEPSGPVDLLTAHQLTVYALAPLTARFQR